jgi:hypothetical protein
VTAPATPVARELRSDPEHGNYWLEWFRPPPAPGVIYRVDPGQEEWTDNGGSLPVRRVYAFTVVDPVTRRHATVEPMTPHAELGAALFAGVVLTDHRPDALTAEIDAALNRPLTLIDLQVARRATAIGDDGTGPLWIHAACHRDSPLRMMYLDGTLTLYCAECETQLCQIAL